jgi:hypothetical protein
MIEYRSVARWFGVTAVVAVAVGLLSAGAANADTFVPMSNEEVDQPLQDGSVLKVRLVGQSATISPSLGSTPLHRNAWVSATVETELDNGTNLGGSILPGYVVGCQVAINGGGVNGNSTAAQAGNTTAVSAGAGATLSLGPGQAQEFYLLDLEQPDPFGADSHQVYNFFKGNKSSVSWSDTTIQLVGCAGYAQARAFARIDVETPTTRGTVIVWGPPFSIG